jgi:hypothetical protein
MVEDIPKRGKSRFRLPGKDTKVSVWQFSHALDIWATKIY